MKGFLCTCPVVLEFASLSFWFKIGSLCTDYLQIEYVVTIFFFIDSRYIFDFFLHYLCFSFQSMKNEFVNFPE